MSKKELSIASKNEAENKRRIQKFLEDKKVELYKVSLPDEVQVKLSKWLNQDVLLLVSPKKNKKYRVYDEKMKSLLTLVILDLKTLQSIKTINDEIDI